MVRGSQLTENITKVIAEIEKLGGTVQSNKLIKHMEGLKTPDYLSHQTTRNALNEGVNRNVIEKVERDVGNQKTVFYSTNTEWVKNEQGSLDEFENYLQWYDEKFGKLKRVFPDLPVYYKADGIFTLGFFMLVFAQTLLITSDVFGQTKKWKDLQNQLVQRQIEYQKLFVPMTEQKEMLETLNHVMNFQGELFYSSIEDVEDFFKELKKLPNFRTNSTKKGSKKGPL